MTLEDSQAFNRPQFEAPNEAPNESRRRYRGILAAGLAGIFGKGTNLLVSAATICRCWARLECQNHHLLGAPI